MRKISKVLLVCLIVIISVGCSASSGEVLELNNRDLKNYKLLSEKQDSELLKKLTPVEVVKMYFYSLYQQDYNTPELLLNDQDQAAFLMFKKQFEKYTAEEVKLVQSTLASIKDFELANETSEVAFVQFKISSIGNENEYDTNEVKLEKQDDAWKFILGKQSIKD